MQNFLTLIKQRRFWASVSGTIALILQLSGVGFEFDSEKFIDTTLSIVNGLSVLATMFLPLLSYFKTKKDLV